MVPGLRAEPRSRRKRAGITTGAIWAARLNEGTDKLAKLVTYGAHADRPDPANMPDGALYVETDRGVIYANEGGVWQYVAGTMWDTLSPDNRPTDLGAHDAGIRLPHDRPASARIHLVADGMDRGDAGSIRHARAALGGCRSRRSSIRRYGSKLTEVLSINSRTERPGNTSPAPCGEPSSPIKGPTDLGTHDAGFDFRTTDAPPREFIWSQTAWVETTSISGGANLTHPNVVTKVGAVGQIVEGGITDASAGNSSKVYISASGNVGIGTTNPGAKLSLGAVVGNTSAVYESAGASLYGIGTNGDGSGGNPFRMPFYANGTEWMSLTSSGNVGIGTIAPSLKLTLGADSAGKPSTSTWSVVSDLRLKQNIKPVEDDSLAILAKLDWIRFEYNGLAGMPPGEKAIGLIAQELQKQLPEAVRSTKTKLNKTDTVETQVMAIDYHYIIVHSARAIQQLSAEVQALASADR